MNDTYDPIRRDEIYKAGYFTQIPLPNPGCVILLISPFSRVLEIRETSMISAYQLRKGKYDRLIEIDVSRHQISINAIAFCSDDVQKFIIKVELFAKVEHPSEVYRLQIHDVAALAQKYYEMKISTIARQYALSNRDEFANDLSAHLEGVLLLESNAIELTMKNVFIDIDEKARARKQGLVDIAAKLEAEAAIKAAADELRKEYDYESGLFQDYFDGKISREQIYDKSFNRDMKEFDEKIRKLNRYKELVQDLADKGIIDEQYSREMMNTSMRSLMNPTIEQKQLPELKQSEENDLYGHIGN